MRWIVFGVVFAGCNGDKEQTDTGTDSAPPACTGLDLTTGTGALSYQPVAPGDPINVVRGPQGGWHVDTSALLTGTNPDVQGDPVITLASGQQLTTTTSGFDALADYDQANCTGTLLGKRAFIDNFPTYAQYQPQAYICTLEGEPAELCINITDFDGQFASDCVDVVISLDPSNICGNGTTPRDTGSTDTATSITTP